LQTFRRREKIMDAFSPELAPHWLASRGGSVDERCDTPDRNDELSPAQQVALEELTERVNAARSVY
jgi:hypothetical protein